MASACPSLSIASAASSSSIASFAIQFGGASFSSVASSALSLVPCSIASQLGDALVTGITTTDVTSVPVITAVPVDPNSENTSMPAATTAEVSATTTTEVPATTTLEVPAPTTAADVATTTAINDPTTNAAAADPEPTPDSTKTAGGQVAAVEASNTTTAKASAPEKSGDQPAPESSVGLSNTTAKDKGTNAPSVTFVPGTGSTPTATSTISDKLPAAETTFASPQSVVLTNPTNGQTMVVTPSFVTSLSTSYGSDGGYLTFTHVAANPTGFLNANDRSGSASGFFTNTGAVAGTFTGVGVIVGIGIVLGLILFKRRRRTVSQHQRWLRGIQPRSDDGKNPFSDSDSVTGVPVMRSVTVTSDNRHWDQTSSRPSLGEGVGIGRAGSSSHGHHSAFSEDSTSSPIGLAVTTDRDPQVGYSSARSSPSIYPPTLHPVDEEEADGNMDTQWPVMTPSQELSVPPRPARSVLRQSSKPLGFGDNGGSSFGMFDSAVNQTRETDVLRSMSSSESMNRRLLLDVKPRSSPDNYLFHSGSLRTSPTKGTD